MHQLSLISGQLSKEELTKTENEALWVTSVKQEALFS